MHTTNLRKVGGSVMLAVPRAILDMLHLEAGATVGLAVNGEQLVVVPQPKPRYTLDELLAQCDLGQLAGGGMRQLLDEDHVIGDAPTRDFAFVELD